MGRPPVSRQGTRGAESSGSSTVQASGEHPTVWGRDPAWARGTWDVPRPSFSLHDAGQAGDPSVTLDLATERGQSRTRHLSVACPGCASAGDSGG